MRSGCIKLHCTLYFAIRTLSSNRLDPLQQFLVDFIRQSILDPVASFEVDSGRVRAQLCMHLFSKSGNAYNVLRSSPKEGWFCKNIIFFGKFCNNMRMINLRIAITVRLRTCIVLHLYLIDETFVPIQGSSDAVLLYVIRLKLIFLFETQKAINSLYQYRAFRTHLRILCPFICFGHLFICQEPFL